MANRKKKKKQIYALFCQILLRQMFTYFFTVLLKSCDMIVQNRGGWGQGPFEYRVEEISILVEDGFQILQSFSEEEKTSLSNSKSDDKKQRLETMGGDKHSMVTAP